MLNILSDSCCDLSPELKQKYSIDTIPLNVIHNDINYKDGIDINNLKLFELVEQNGQLPKTSAPSVAEFIEFYKGHQGDILFCGIGNKFSATFQNAQLAAQTFSDRKFYFVDSFNLSSGVGQLLLRAAEMNQAGVEPEKIVSTLENSQNKVKTAFVIDTLDYLHKGGRCSAMQNIIGSLLKIRPIIEVRQDGTMGIREKTRGTRKKALECLLQGFSNHLNQVDLHRVFVTHTGCDEDAQFLVNELQKIAPIQEMCVTIAGATITSHCGPNTIGIIYFLK
jgi:DegV family protein with EDD domain